MLAFSRLSRQTQAANSELMSITARVANILKSPWLWQALTRSNGARRLRNVLTKFLTRVICRGETLLNRRWKTICLRLLTTHLCHRLLNNLAQGMAFRHPFVLTHAMTLFSTPKSTIRVECRPLWEISRTHQASMRLSARTSELFSIKVAVSTAKSPHKTGNRVLGGLTRGRLLNN